MDRTRFVDWLGERESGFAGRPTPFRVARGRFSPLRPGGFRFGRLRGRRPGMGERQRLLALLEVYDTAIEELYVLGDRGLLDLILRLERRRQDAAGRLAASGHEVPNDATLDAAPIAASPTPL
jgi:hypothetical protein